MITSTYMQKLKYINTENNKHTMQFNKFKTVFANTLVTKFYFFITFILKIPKIFQTYVIAKKNLMRKIKVCHKKHLHRKNIIKKKFHRKNNTHIN